MGWRIAKNTQLPLKYSDVVNAVTAWPMCSKQCPKQQPKESGGIHRSSQPVMDWLLKHTLLGVDHAPLKKGRRWEFPDGPMVRTLISLWRTQIGELRCLFQTPDPSFPHNLPVWQPPVHFNISLWFFFKEWNLSGGQLNSVFYLINFGGHAVWHVRS